MLRYRLAFGLFAAGILLSTAASAWAFSQQIVSPDGGNYSFGDSDKQPTTSDKNSSRVEWPVGAVRCPAGAVDHFWSG
jgi:hypothetical protein